MTIFGLDVTSRPRPRKPITCAVQSAWAYALRHKGYGMPESCDPLEGCIADPQCSA